MLLLRNRGVIVLVRGEPDAGRPAPCVTAWQCDRRGLAGGLAGGGASRRPNQSSVADAAANSNSFARARGRRRTFFMRRRRKSGRRATGRRAPAPPVPVRPRGRPSRGPWRTPLLSPPPPAPSLHRCPQPPRAVFFLCWRNAQSAQSVGAWRADNGAAAAAALGPRCTAAAGVRV